MKKSMLVFVMLAMVILSGCNVFEENKSLKAKNQELEQRVIDLYSLCQMCPLLHLYVRNLDPLILISLPSNPQIGHSNGFRIP